MEENTPIGYVYITENLVNGKRYIGQHQAKEFDKNYLGSGVSLCKAVKKYGRKNFKSIIIEWCNSLDELNERETYWITYYNAAFSKDFYNISEMGKAPCLSGEKNPNYGKKNSPETIRKKSEALIGHIVTEETRQKLREANLGKKHSQETKEKLRKLSTGRKHTLEDLEKMKKNSRKGKDNPACRPEIRATINKDKCKPVQCIETGQIFNSTREAANFFNIKCDANIGHSARDYNKGISHKGNGYHWRYI